MNPLKHSGGLLLGALLALAAPARAAGVNLAWNECLSEGGVGVRSVPCGSDAGTNDAVGSFSVSRPQPQFVGCEVVLDLQADGPRLPDWWQFFNSGACRQNALTASFDFTTAPQGACQDPFSGLAMGGVAGYHTSSTQPPVPSARANAARIILAMAVANPVGLSSGTEYYAFRLRISNQRTSGGGGCAGCASPVCITLSELRAAESDGRKEILTTALQSNGISWQTSSTCATGNQNRTWGSIKQLYR